MTPEPILFPVFGMVGLTFVVWITLYFQRVGYMRRERIRPQAVASRAESRTALKAVSGSSDNFQNLLELPVLFYLLAALLLVTGHVDGVHVGLAWLFTGLRVTHSAIHITYNRVMHRFLAFVAGGVTLWIMWARFAFQII